MKIAVACDHGALNLKKAVLAYLEKNGHEYVDFGTHTTDSCDYPDYAVLAAEAGTFLEVMATTTTARRGMKVSPFMLWRYPKILPAFISIGAMMMEPMVTMKPKYCPALTTFLSSAAGAM